MGDSGSWRRADLSKLKQGVITLMSCDNELVVTLNRGAMTTQPAPQYMG